MKYWHMQLHPGEFSSWDADDIKQLLEANLIGCAGEPIQTFNGIEIGDIVLIRHGGTVVALVKVEEAPRPILPEEKVGDIWYDQCARVKVLRYYTGLSVSGFGWFLPKTLMIVDNEVAFNYINKLYMDYNSETRIKEVTDLLNYKKQIILQGPPGTGKTRLAKQIALDMIKPIEISEKEIREIIKPAMEIPSITNSTRYVVSNLTDTAVSLKLQNGSIQSTTFDKINIAYKTNKWNTGTTGGDAYEAAIAKYIYNNILSEGQYKIVQFHPSYNYEDFVRGIIVKASGEKIEYKTENKILGEFANDALDNYLKSEKFTDEELSKTLWIEKHWPLFINFVENNVAQIGKYPLTEKVYIYEIENDCFRYSGDDWKNASRLNFSDCKKLIKFYIDKSISDLEFDIKISRHAFYRQPYYSSIIKLFFSKYTYEKSSSFKEKTKNFVIIIDEINRANLPSVLGELIYALEYRGEKVESMYAIEDDNSLVLPPNLFIIGTMNTADRSVGHIDYAIRRRFAFVDVLPAVDPIHPAVRPLFKEISELFITNFDDYQRNSEIQPAAETLAADFRPEDVWIGHSYFICKKENSDENIPDAEAKPILANKLKYEVLPILKEYMKDGILLDNEKTKTVLKKILQWN